MNRSAGHTSLATLTVLIFAVLPGTAVLFVPADAPVAGQKAPSFDEEPCPRSDDVVGPDRCSECHASEHAAWKMSSHARGFETMHRKAEAKKIAKQLGIRRIKSAPSCMSCHYTPVEKRGRKRAKFGVSCEGCHGAAKSWIDSHDELADLDPKTHASARAAHLGKLTSMGMRHPEDIVRLAASCYACHVVADEKVVNTGGHPVGGPFELVAWSQGEVRHNYLESAGIENEECSPARKRLLFAVGRALDLRFALSGLAKATQSGPYLEGLQKRARSALKNLEAAAAAAPQVPELAQIHQIGRRARLELGQRVSLEKLSDDIIAATRALAKAHDGTRLGSLDPLLPKPSEYRGSARR